MLSQECRNELHSAWLPNMTDEALERVIDLLEKDSPLLIRGSFTRAVPQGCLATQVAWHHPRTAHLTLDAGVTWLHHVAGLNPATSHVIREWDRSRFSTYEFRSELLTILKEHREGRRGVPSQDRLADEASHIAVLVAE